MTEDVSRWLSEDLRRWQMIYPEDDQKIWVVGDDRRHCFVKQNKLIVNNNK